MVLVNGRPKSTPLHEAASLGNMEAVTRLLESGISPNQLTNESVTPLHLAAKEGHLDIVRLLTARVSNIDVHDFSGWTPLFAAVSRGHLEVVKHLLAHGADPDSVDSDGRCILHLAAKNPAMLEFLIPLVPSRLNYPDRAGSTPLDVAERLNAYSGIAVLKGHRARHGV